MARISKEKQNEIRGNILDFARKSFMKNGYENTSTKDMAKAVGIAEGTLFNYFNSKADIFAEALTMEFLSHETSVEVKYSPKDLPPAIIYDYMMQLYKPILHLPKRIIIEGGIALITVSKKNFSLFRKLAEMDFKYIEKVKLLICDLKSKGMLTEDLDETLLSENIFSAFLYELLMYGYIAEMTKSEMTEHFKNKVWALCKGYLA